MIDVESRKRKKESFRTNSIMLILFALYIGLAMGNAYVNMDIDPSSETTPNIVDILDATIKNIQAAPWRIFPTHLGYVAGALLLAFFVWSLMYQNFLETLRMMPNQENGTMEFETNYKRFYHKFLYDPATITSTKIKSTWGKICAMFKGIRIDPDTGIKYMKRKFVSKEELAACKKNALILSQIVYLSLNTKFTQRNLNTLVLGSAGTGKSRFFVKPNILQAHSSYVITDPSGDIMAELGTYLEQKCGYKIICFNIQDMTMSNRYNPFHYIKCNEDIPIMINCLMKNTDNGRQGTDPFWDRSETALLCACCGYLFEARPESERNFSNVMKMLNMVEIEENGKNDKKNDLDLLFDDWEKKYPESYAVKNYKIFKMAPGKTALTILITAGVRIGTYFNLEKVANLTSCDEMELEQIGNRKTALFIVTPQGDTTYSFLVSMLYTQLFEVLYKVGEEKGKKTNGNVALDIPVRCIIDEFANVGKIPDFQIKLATMRKYNISACPILQSQAQLKEMYEKEYEGIMANCDTTLFLGGQEPSTLEMLSKKLGKDTIYTKSKTRNYSKGGGSSISQQNAGRELLMAEEIGQMDNKQCLVFIRGCMPFCTKKYPYQLHPAYKYTAEKNAKYLYKIKVPEIDSHKTTLFEETGYISPLIQQVKYGKNHFNNLQFPSKTVVLSLNRNKENILDADIIDLSIMQLTGDIVYDSLFKSNVRSSKEILSKLHIVKAMLKSAPLLKAEWEQIYNHLISQDLILVDNKKDCLEQLQSALKNNKMYEKYKEQLELLEHKMVSVYEITRQIINMYNAQPTLNQICEKLDIELESIDLQSDYIRGMSKNQLLLNIITTLDDKADRPVNCTIEDVSEKENEKPSKEIVISNDSNTIKAATGESIDEIILNSSSAKSPANYEFEIPYSLEFTPSDITKKREGNQTPNAIQDDIPDLNDSDGIADDVYYSLGEKYMSLSDVANE